MQQAAEYLVEGWRWESAQPVECLNRWERGNARHQEGARRQERNRHNNHEGGEPRKLVVCGTTVMRERS
jgi:hypothetical protein